MAIPEGFNPDTDADRPVIGSIITAPVSDDEEETEMAQYKVQSVGYTTLKVMMESAREGGPDEIPTYNSERALLRAHATRPGVLWIAYCNKV